MMNKMDFQQQLKEWNDRELLEFLALQQYDMCVECVSRRQGHEARLTLIEDRQKNVLHRLGVLESSDRRVTVWSTLIAGAIATAVSVVAWFGLKR